MALNKTIRSIGAEVRHILCAWPFWAAAALTFLLCGITEIPQQESSAFALMWLGSDSLLAERPGAALLFLSLPVQMWFIILLPLVAGIPFVYDFYEEWFSGSYYCVLYREGRRGYAAAKAITAALSAGGAIALGLLLYAAVLAAGFGFDEKQPIVQGMAELKTMAALGLNITAVSMVFALVSLWLVIVLRQKFLALTVPMMLQYLSYRLTDLYTGLQLQQYRIDGDEQGLYQSLAITYLLPSNQFSLYSVFQKYTGMPLLVYYLMLLALALTLGCWIHFLLERRVKGCG